MDLKFEDKVDLQSIQNNWKNTNVYMTHHCILTYPAIEYDVQGKTLLGIASAPYGKIVENHCCVVWLPCFYRSHLYRWIHRMKLMTSFHDVSVAVNALVRVASTK